MPDTTLQPTSAAGWKVAGSEGSALEGFIVTFPSGNTARIKRTMDLFMLLKTGRIPNPLAGTINKMIQSKGAALDMSDMPEEAVPQLMSFIDDIALRTMMEPRVERPYVAADDSEEELRKENEWVPSEGAIPLPVLEMSDKMYLMKVAMGGPTDLTSFREQQEAALGTPQNRSGVRAAAKRGTKST